jgi:formylglycine-generating enzyme required for sulfatase activity
MVRGSFHPFTVGLHLAGLACLIAALSLLPWPAAVSANDDSEERAGKRAEVVDERTVTIDAGGVKMVFVLIPRGQFLMGSPKTEAGRSDDEVPHAVEISRPFYLAKYPVTQHQYRALMKKNPSHFQAGKGGADAVKGLDTDQLPVENVSWEEAQAFCQKMRANDQHRREFRLPTEAEWEYACRGGTKTAYWFGEDLKKLGDHAWFRENAQGRTQVIGTKKANPWGLSDMHGNVWQWCADVFDSYPKETVTDPQGPVANEGSGRVFRGGGWGSDPQGCRSAVRGPRLGRAGGPLLRPRLPRSSSRPVK